LGKKVLEIIGGKKKGTRRVDKQKEQGFVKFKRKEALGGGSGVGRRGVKEDFQHWNREFAKRKNGHNGLARPSGHRGRRGRRRAEVLR